MEEKEIYRTKYPSKEISISFVFILGVLLYIFWGILNYYIITLIGLISLYLISVTMIPIFILKEKSFNRKYFLKPFNSCYKYNLSEIEKIEIRQNRQGYQSFPTMKIFFKQKGKVKKDLFHFIKSSQKDIDKLISESKKKNINIMLLKGN